MRGSNDAMPGEPLVGEDGEVRELTDADLARGRIGAPWTRPTERARSALRDAINALKRAEGDERAALEPTLDHLRASLRQVERLAAEA